MAYGDKRDYKKIDIYINGKYWRSTNWARNLKVAKNKAVELNGFDPSIVSAKYA
jgi:hypothetical protein